MSVLNTLTALRQLAAIAASGNAADLAAGTVATARLGSGSASSSTYLRGDNTWATPAGGGSSGTGIPVFNVTDSAYGATGDGTTDDTAAINAAVTAANAAGGGIVYFPKGTYIISAPIVGKDKVRFVGAGRATVTLKAKSTFAPTVTDGGGLIQWQGPPFDSTAPGTIFTFVGVSDMTIDMSAAPDTVTNQINAIWQDYSQLRHCLIERVAYVGAKNGQGILLNGLGRITGGNSYDITIRDITATNGAGTVSLYLNSVTDATATYHGVTIDNVWNEITTISGIVDDRVVIAGGQVSDAGSLATIHDIAIKNIKVVIQTGATVTGLVNGVKIDTGKAVTIRNVSIRDVYMWGNGSTTVSGHPVITFLGGQTGTLGGLQDLLIDGVYAWHTCGVAVKWRRVDTAPSIIVRNVHLNGAVTGSTGWPIGIMLYCLSAPVGDEMVLVDGATMDATSSSMMAVCLTSDTPSTGSVHGASGLVAIKNIVASGFATGVTLAKNAAGGAATQTGWNNLSLQDITLVSYTTATSLLSKSYRARNVTGLADNGASVQGMPTPATNSYLAWTFDPKDISASQAAVTQTCYLAKAYLAAGVPITNITVQVATAATAITTGYVGICDSTGAQVGVSADQSSSWTSTGVKVVALASAYTPPTDGWYFLQLQCAGTGLPAFQRCSTAGQMNNGLAAPNLRASTLATGSNTIPSSLTLGSQAASNILMWMALS